MQSSLFKKMIYKKNDLYKNTLKMTHSNDEKLKFLNEVFYWITAQISQNLKYLLKTGQTYSFAAHRVLGSLFTHEHIWRKTQSPKLYKAESFKKNEWNKTEIPKSSQNCFFKKERVTKSF